MKIFPNLLFLLAFALIISSCGENKKETKKEVLLAMQKVEKSVQNKKTLPKMKGLDLDYCMGKFSPQQHADFIAIPIKYADREGMYMRKDAYGAFEKMYAAALKDGVQFQIRSAARNFDYQKGIWERKWTGETKLSDGTDVSKDIKEPIDKALKILEYSSMPGTSRHHWGTDIDLNSFNNEFFENGVGLKIYTWLTDHAAEYGFCQPYTPKGKDRPEGYNEEKWHWSYQPVSQGITDFAEQNLKNAMIQGFKGSKTAVEIDVVSKFVLGINQGCRH